LQWREWPVRRANLALLTQFHTQNGPRSCPVVPVGVLLACTKLSVRHSTRTFAFWTSFVLPLCQNAQHDGGIGRGRTRAANANTGLRVDPLGGLSPNSPGCLRTEDEPKNHHRGRASSSLIFSTAQRPGEWKQNLPPGFGFDARCCHAPLFHLSTRSRHSLRDRDHLSALYSTSYYRCPIMLDDAGVPAFEGGRPGR
jgi:hypothetical protein